ncbi:MAG TPA: copper-binding protein [Burkholderiales bacterium]|nr:copper-binding protein [Burkholderiales bacterium]
MKFILTTVLFIAAASPTFADDAHHPPKSDAAPVAQAQAPATQSLTDGEVRKVDKATGKLTLRHGELKNLDMPSMTMVFQVSDATVLDRLKVGDKVRFSADRVNGAITVTAIEIVAP